MSSSACVPQNRARAEGPTRAVVFTIALPAFVALTVTAVSISNVSLPYCFLEVCQKTFRTSTLIFRTPRACEFNGCLKWHFCAIAVPGEATNRLSRARRNVE